MDKFDLEFCQHLEDRYGYTTRDARAFVKKMDTLQAIELAAFDLNFDVEVTARRTDTFKLGV